MNWKMWTAAVAASVLAAGCGGGGGNPGTAPFNGASGSTVGGGDIGTTTVVTPTTISFVSMTPSDQPLLIRGSNAIGRTDTATMQFRVTDQFAQPVKGVEVSFSVTPASAVDMHTSSAVTDANGIVQATLTSKTTPTTVVVAAVLTSNSHVKTISNTLSITAGDPVSTAFQVAAEKYNVDGRFIGDKTDITAFVADIHGNPVADGFAVNFMTAGGKVDGQCVTVKGECSVKFTVQNPFPDDGIATVHAEGVVNSVLTLSQDIYLNMAGSTRGQGYVLTNESATDTTPVTSTILSNCKEQVVYQLNDGLNHALAAGSTVAVVGLNGATASVTFGSPVADVLDGSFSPSLLIVSYDLSGVSGSMACSNSGTGSASGVNVKFTMTSPHGASYYQDVRLTYPH